MNEQADLREALRALIEKQQSKEWLSGDWIKPLEEIMNDGSKFTSAAQNLPFPMVVYNQNGEVELANDILLEEAGLSNADIESGIVNIMGTSYTELADAVMMVFHKKITVVNGLQYPLDTFVRSGSPANPRCYKTAIVFPCMEDGPVLRGVALFLPFELYENDKSRNGEKVDEN